MPESLPAALSRLIGSGCKEFTKTLVIDCGGTTLDMGIIVGEFDDVSDVYGNNEIGVSMVTDATRKALAAADNDSSHLVANEFIKRRHDMSFVRDVVNDESQIPKILEKMQRTRSTSWDPRWPHEAKKFIRTRTGSIWSVAASLIVDAIKAAYPTLGERVELLDDAQSALAREICLYTTEEEEVYREAPVMAEVGDE